MLPITRKISKYNFSFNNNPRYIVIHDTGNKTDSASGNANYFNEGNRGASAHYFVDDNSIYQVVEEYNAAWHCGDGRGKYGITNYNSIGIEMCRVNNVVTNTTENNTIELVKYLMNKYSISTNKVVRHYDASRKCCPSSFSTNNWARWISFKDKLNAIDINYNAISLEQCDVEDGKGNTTGALWLAERCELKWVTNDYRKYVKYLNSNKTDTKEGLVEKDKTDKVIPIDEAYNYYNAGTNKDVFNSSDLTGEPSGAIWENEKFCVLSKDDKKAFVVYDNSAGEKLCKTGYIDLKDICKIGEKPSKEELFEENKNTEIHNTLYKVQVGAFAKKENAERYIEELKKKGVDACIKE